MTQHRVPTVVAGTFWRVRAAVALAAGLVLATAAVLLVGYQATKEWRRSTMLSVERRANEVVALLAVALNRDMKGAQLSVLVPINQDALVLDPPYDIAHVVAGAFARFPYAESFFAWRSDGSPRGLTYFFNRSDRPPPWDKAIRPIEPYPVVTLRDPQAARRFVEHARDEAKHRKRFVLFEETVEGAPYQTVVHMLYSGRPDAELFGFIGFTVNLEWVRREYFVDIMRQVQRIGGAEGGLTLTILDERGGTVASVGERSTGEPVRERPFSLLFFEQSLVSSLPPDRPPVRRWLARVSAGRDPSLAAAGRGAERTYMLSAIAALVVSVALLLTVRAVRASTELAVMKSEFVSAVTHELKTPLAAIRLVADTLSMGRYSSTETVSDYARLLSKETGHLTSLIENLLTYARVADVKSVYSFGVVDVGELIEECVDSFRPRLAELGCAVAIDVPPDLPAVRGDQTMLLHALHNLLDNALKYSSSKPDVRVSAALNGSGTVKVEVADRGDGIPADELPRVQEKFFRGRNAKKSGSGLGLAIVSRIVQDHGGRVEISSEVGQGTRVEVSLPVGGGA